MANEVKPNNFDNEFDRQVNGNLCGGALCINPNCFCDEVETEDKDRRSKSSLIVYAADEPTTFANEELVGERLITWAGDFTFYCSQVVALLACSVETEDLAALLARADENAAEMLPMLVMARHSAQKGVSH